MPDVHLLMSEPGIEKWEEDGALVGRTEKSLGKRKRACVIDSDDSDSDDNQPKPTKKSSAINEREKKLDEVMTTLQEKHVHRI